MGTYYKVELIMRKELNNYKSGVVEEGYDYGVVDSFRVEYLTEVVKELKDRYTTNFKKAKDTHDTGGPVFEVTVLEDEHDSKPTKEDLKKYNKGEIDLWLTNYQIHITKVVNSRISYEDYKAEVT